MSNINLETKLELIDEQLFDGSDREAFASISLNPTFQWAKIVVTDDQPNANKHRVPIEEFDNIINTGIFAPIKMTESKISSGHLEAMGKPIGIIAQLIKSNNKVIALAALWKRERPDDIELLKEMYKNGTPPNVSWELSYAESKAIGDVEELHGISLNGLAVVNSPAYTGRTPFIAMASKDDEQTSDPDSSSNKEENIVNEEELKQKISELESQLDLLKNQLSEKDAELDTLREFKSSIDKEKEKQTRIAEIKNKFSVAKIEKDESYWESNIESLLNMTDASLDFMIQELVSFLETSAAITETNKKVEIPNLKGDTSNKDVSPSELGKMLRERFNK